MDENENLNTQKNQPQISVDTSKNFHNFGEIKLDNFEEGLNLSDIGDEDGQTPKKKEDHIITEDFSEDLDNINDDEFNNQRKLSDSSFQSDEFKNGEDINLDINTNVLKNRRTNNDISKKYTKKLTKEELDNIPIPVFSCIYCSNMIIAFKHLSQEIVTNKYLFQTSIYDIKDINKLLIYQPLIDNDKKNEKLLNLIFKNTEYISYNYTSQKIQNFFKSENYVNICMAESSNHKKILTQKIEENIIRKKKDFYFRGINKIPKNSIYNNRCLFNSTNSLINNYNTLSGLVELIPGGNCNINTNINYNNFNINNKNNNTNNSNLSLNFNSISYNNNETGNYLCKDNNNLLVSIVEHIENNNEANNELDDKEEFMDFLKLEEDKEKEDNKEKFDKENIIWDDHYYNIWDPNFDEYDINDDECSENYFKCEVNNNNNDNNYLKKNVNYLNNNNSNIFINKKRKNYKNNNINSLNNIINENLEDKKNYKLKVNLLKTKAPTNSINFASNQKLGMSQLKSFGSTNSSTMINYDNDCILKNQNFSSTKDFSNNSQILIYVNTLQEGENFNKILDNNSMIMNKNVPSKSQNFFHEVKHNKVKVYPNLINVNNSCNFHPNLNKTKEKLKICNTYKNFFFGPNHINFKINNNYDISNIINRNNKNKKNNKYYNNKIFKNNNKIKALEIKRTKTKHNFNHKLNSFNTTKTLLNNNNSSMNKTISTYKNKNQISLSHIFNNSKVISSKIIFSLNHNRNNKFTQIKYSTNNLLDKKPLKKKENNVQRKINLSVNKEEKISMEKIRKKIAELNKYIKNKRINNFYNNNKRVPMKIESNFTKSDKKNILTFSKDMNIFSDTKNKNMFCTRKKLCLTNSFLIRSKAKDGEKSNRKKFMFFKD